MSVISFSGCLWLSKQHLNSVIELAGIVFGRNSKTLSMQVLNVIRSPKSGAANDSVTGKVDNFCSDKKIRNWGLVIFPLFR